ncbi:Uncharacterized protein HZ326_16216 [Fusarium oxysporum f. sp. albedinis]|nr:Uncharacterized protein HZ326_16216 [Fusarium oxysporum f. sp. albedinis]
MMGITRRKRRVCSGGMFCHLSGYYCDDANGQLCITTTPITSELLMTQLTVSARNGDGILRSQYIMKTPKPRFSSIPLGELLGGCLVRPRAACKPPDPRLRFVPCRIKPHEIFSFFLASRALIGCSPRFWSGPISKFFVMGPFIPD